MFEILLSLPPGQAFDEEALKNQVLLTLGENSDQYESHRILHCSIDARGSNIKVNLKVLVAMHGEALPPLIPAFHFKSLKKEDRVIIVGAGPAGLFAALQLLECGIQPVIIERGKTVRERRRDIARLNREHVVHKDSNYCFGEGGAGTYSDGKLFTRSTKRGDVRRVLQWLVAHGAGEEILADAHPHIGTNKLPLIIESLRLTILQNGGEIHFNTRLETLVIHHGSVHGVRVRHLGEGREEELNANAVVLATGHSARDVYHMLQHQNIRMERKPFALGVRVEHPQELIDAIQYHCRSKDEVAEKRRWLPAAPYSLVHQEKGRGVFSFCMCPGGIIAPCATQPGEVVVNGWSPSKRNNPFANSGIVTAVMDCDLHPFASAGALAGLCLQQSLEQMACVSGGGNQTAPAQRLVDFVEGRQSANLPQTSYQPGIASAPLHELLPTAIGTALQHGFIHFGKKMRGYLTQEAVIHGVETRTSSPIRIPRHRESFMHPDVAGLYPVGEGAGYAGGIMSAAIDGMNAAMQIAARLNP